MKLVIASDLHGSLYYAQKLIDRFETEKGDKLVILGDFYYHGPRNVLPQGYDPAKVANILNAYKSKIIAIKGNCDSEVDQTISEFTMEESLNIEADGKTITLSHGHKFDINNMPVYCGDIFLYGHYHVPFVQEKDGVIVASPGSISLPKQDSKHTYMTIENDIMLIKSLDGEIIIKKELK